MTSAIKRRSNLAAEFIQAANREPRRGFTDPSIVLLHYTGMKSAAAAVDWLVREDSRVSCHYLVDEEGRITQMVEEHERAWHAGQSFWRGIADINSASIGIEIHNPGHEFGSPPFPDPQMRAVEELCLDIMRRHRIRGECVLGHSDVAPARKADPGERFDWSRLARRGIGIHVEAAQIEEGASLGLGDRGTEVEQLKSALHRIGFGVDPGAGFDLLTEQTVTAFQRHWRPQKVDGRADRSTLLTLGRVDEAFAAARTLA